MAKGRTAWERLTGQNKPVPVEKQYANPLDVRVGATAMINTVDYLKRRFVVSEIWAWDRSTHGQKTAGMTDYVLESKEGRVVLRVLPRTGHNPKDARSHHFLLLDPYFEQGWADDSAFILEALDDPTGEFFRHKGEPEEEHYWRVNDVKVPYHCSVALLRDIDRNGTVEEEEVVKGEFTLWDFWRTTSDEAGQEYTQFLYAHLSGRYDPKTRRVAGGDKVITILRGSDVDPDNVRLFDKA